MSENTQPRETADHSSESADSIEARQRAAFRIGGQEQGLSAQEQLEQITSYLEAHYTLPDFTPPWRGGSGDPTPADNYCARLPDRISHAAMLQLGSGVDHAMPGVAFVDKHVDVEDLTLTDAAATPAQLFTPQDPSETWVISLHSGGWWRGGGNAMEMQWRPEVAAVASLSHARCLDLDYPLAPQHTIADMNSAVTAAVDYVRGRGAETIVLWGYSSGAALALLNARLADALVLTYPDFSSVAGLPEDVRAGHSIPDNPWDLVPDQAAGSVFVQFALEDEIASRPRTTTAQKVSDYVSTHRVATPEVTRRRVRDVATFVAGL